MFCIVVMEKIGCADFVSNPGAEYSIYDYSLASQEPFSWDSSVPRHLSQLVCSLQL